MLEEAGRVVSVGGGGAEEERFRRDVHAVALEVTGSPGVASLLDRLVALNRRAGGLALDHPFGQEVLDCVIRLGSLMRAVQDSVPKPQPPAPEPIRPEVNC